MRLRVSPQKSWSVELAVRQFISTPMQTIPWRSKSLVSSSRTSETARVFGFFMAMDLEIEPMITTADSGREALPHALGVRGGLSADDPGGHERAVILCQDRQEHAHDALYDAVDVDHDPAFRVLDVLSHGDLANFPLSVVHVPEMDRGVKAREPNYETGTERNGVGQLHRRAATFQPIAVSFSLPF